MFGESGSGLAFGARLFFTAQARGPVVYDEVHALTGQAARYHQLVAGEEVGELFGVEAGTAARLDRKLVFVVDEAHVDTPGIG